MRLDGRLSAGFQHRYIPHFFIATSLVGSAIIASGCGSGSGGNNNPGPSPSSSATPSPTPSASATPSSSPVVVTTRIVWGPRSRQVGTQTNAVGGPSSALSARIVLASGANAGTNPVLTLDVNRGVPSGPQDFSSAPQQITPGIYLLTATFYANPNGASVTGNPVVGTAQASVTVLANGTISATIATVGTIQKVVVVPDASGGGFQLVGLNQTRTVAYTALDASGNIIAVTPGSAFVTVQPNTNPDGTKDTMTRATASGETVTGVFPNRATIVVTVDNVSSAPTLIVVRSNVQIAVSPNPVTVGLGQAQTFNVTINNDGPAGSNGVLFQVLRNGVVDSAQNAGALSTSGPGTQTVFTASGALGSQTGVVTNNVPNSYVLRVISFYDPDIFVDVPITITSLVNVTVNPTSAFLSINQTQKFDATVNLLPVGANSAVTWTIQSGGGKITTDGTYTAPSTPQNVVIRATSKFDVTKYVDVPITVQSGSLPIVVN